MPEILGQAVGSEILLESGGVRRYVATEAPLFPCRERYCQAIHDPASHVILQREQVRHVSVGDLAPY